MTICGFSIRKMWIFGVACLVSASCTSPGQSNATDGRADPSTIVRDIYANKFDTIWPETEEHRSDLLSDSLSASFTKSIRTYGQFALTFDPIVNGQDALIENLVIDSAVVKGDYASVKVHFRNFGEDNVLVYSFVLEDDRWKLDELASIGDDGWLLSEVLQNP